MFVTTFRRIRLKVQGFLSLAAEAFPLWLQTSAGGEGEDAALCNGKAKQSTEGRSPSKDRIRASALSEQSMLSGSCFGHNDPIPLMDSYAN